MAKTGSETERHCQHCGKTLYGRSDQRFCNDTCRNTFNRDKALKQQREAHENLPEILKIITRNYEILKAFGSLSDADQHFGIEGKPADQGINTKFFTSIATDRFGDVWRFCFERGWREYDGGWEVCEWKEQAALS